MHVYEIALDDSEMLLTSLMKCKSGESAIDSSLMECLAECYKNADHWSARRQTLSIMANKVSFEDLRRWLPNLTIAKHHLLPPWQRFQCPYCQKHQDVYRPRKAGPLPGIHNQYTYPTRSAIGEKTLKLSSDSEIKVPSVVLQYVNYCSDTGSTPMSRSVLCKVLKVCSASTSDLRIAATKILVGFAGTDRARIFTVDTMLCARFIHEFILSSTSTTTTKTFIYRYLLFAVLLEVLRDSQDEFHEKKPSVVSGFYYSLRGRLHDEFQPGLKFRPTPRAEILLRLHD